jgi:hypothetical protein
MREGRLASSARTRVIERAHGRCEYCLAPLSFSAAPFTIDHVIPRARGGKNGLENLALACGGCNGRKYDAIEAADPATGGMARLFHPRQSDWSTHFVWDETFTRMIGRTPTGRATIDALALNRPELVNLRHALQQLKMHP